MEPGHFAHGYRRHETNEKVFYIIKGTTSVRTRDSEIILQEGGAVAFPAGPQGAHVIRNASETEKLVYWDIGAQAPLAITHFSEINKVLRHDGQARLIIRSFSTFRTHTAPGFLYLPKTSEFHDTGTRFPPTLLLPHLRIT